MTAPWTIWRKLGQIKLAVVGVTLTNFNGVRWRLLQLGGEESSSVQPAFVHVCGTMGGNRPIFTYLIFKRTISGNEIKKSLFLCFFSFFNSFHRSLQNQWHVGFSASAHTTQASVQRVRADSSGSQTPEVNPYAKAGQIWMDFINYYMKNYKITFLKNFFDDAIILKIITAQFGEITLKQLTTYFPSCHTIYCF